MRDAYAGSGDFVYPVARDCSVAPLSYNPHLPLVVGIDPGHQDQTALVWMQRGDVDGHLGLHVLGSYERNLAPAEWYAHLLTGVPPEDGDVCAFIRPTPYERELMDFFGSLPWSFDALQVFGDPAGKQKHTGHSFFDIVTAHSAVLQRRRLEREGAGENETRIPAGIAVIAEYQKGISNLHNDRRQATRHYLGRSQFNATPYGLRVQECLSNYKFASMTPHSTAETKPVHDKFSHVTTAFEFACCGLFAGYGAAPLSEEEKKQRKAERKREKEARKQRKARERKR